MPAKSAFGGIIKMANGDSLGEHTASQKDDTDVRCHSVDVHPKLVLKH